MPQTNEQTLQVDITDRRADTAGRQVDLPDRRADTAGRHGGLCGRPIRRVISASASAAGTGPRLPHRPAFDEARPISQSCEPLPGSHTAKIATHIAALEIGRRWFEAVDVLPQPEKSSTDGIE